MSEICPSTPGATLASLASLARQGSPSGAAVLTALCRTLQVDPSGVKIRISLAELAEAVAAGDILPGMVDRYAPAIGKARAKKL